MNRNMQVILCLVLMFVVCAASPGAKPKQFIPLRVAYNSSFPPYEFEESQTPAGFSISLLKNFAAKRGYTIKWVPMNYEDLVPAVLSAKVDLAVGVAFAESLLSKVECSSGYVSYNTVVAYNRRSGIYKTDQLALKKVVVTSGANRPYHMESLGIGDAERSLNTVQSIASVNDHRYDATLAPEATIAYCQTNKRMNSLSTLPLLLNQRSVCVITQRGRLDLAQSFDEAIEQMREDGSYAKYEEKWLTPYLPKEDTNGRLVWLLVLFTAVGVLLGGYGVYRFRKPPVLPAPPKSLEEYGVAGGQEGVWVLHLDTGVIRVNQALMRMFSLPGESNSVMVASLMRYIPEPYRKLVSGYISDCAKAKRDHYDIEHPINSIEGQQRWLSNHASVVAWDEQGKPAIVAGTCRDVTDAVHKQHELEAENDYFETLMSSIHTVVLLLDEHLRIERCNQHTERVFGIRKDRIAGLNFVTTFIPKERQDDVRARFILLLASKWPASMEENLVTSSGQVRKFRWSVCKLVGLDKKIQWAMIGDDITAQIGQAKRAPVPDRVMDIKAQLYRHIAQKAEIGDVVQSLADAFVDSESCDAVWIGSYDSRNASWCGLASQAAATVPGFSVHAVEKWGLLEQESPLSLACNTHQFYQLSQLSSNRINEAWWNHLVAHGIETIIVQPMVWRERVVGVLLGFRKGAVPLDMDQQFNLSVIADAMCFNVVMSDSKDLLP
ncbi:MAG: transporter substrate-binding domain-containing protein [Armatimonadota bacterium]